MTTCTYRGYEIAIALQRRTRGHCLVAIDIRRGAAAWARYRDVPLVAGDALESAALAEARAMVDDLLATGAVDAGSARAVGLRRLASRTVAAAQPT